MFLIYILSLIFHSHELVLFFTYYYKLAYQNIWDKPFECLANSNVCHI